MDIVFDTDHKHRRLVSEYGDASISLYAIQLSSHRHEIRQLSSFALMNKKSSLKRERFALTLRAWEIRLVARLVGKDHKDILEIGGGNGWQARLLQQNGHTVTSVDIAPAITDTPYFPVITYDGHSLPFKDNSFDVVFSSNVLEHIPHLSVFEAEMHRVLKPSGQAIHVLPTSAWRLWTSVTHPFRVLRAIVNLFHRQEGNHIDTEALATRTNWLYAFWPNRHGEKGTSLSELYWFSQTAWVQHFKKAGWRCTSIVSTSLAYTGNLVTYSCMSVSSRRVLARYLGSATNIYLLSHAPESNHKVHSQN